MNPILKAFFNLYRCDYEYENIVGVFCDGNLDCPVKRFRKWDILPVFTDDECSCRKECLSLKNDSSAMSNVYQIDRNIFPTFTIFCNSTVSITVNNFQFVFVLYCNI